MSAREPEPRPPLRCDTCGVILTEEDEIPCGHLDCPLYAMHGTEPPK